jgi:hypothetical protein
VLWGKLTYLNDMKAKEGAGQVQLVCIAGGKFCLLFVSLWIAFNSIHSALPYIQPGVRIIYTAKADAVKTRGVFLDDRPIRLVIFGSSKILTGFHSSSFIEGREKKVDAFNLGIGGGQFSLDEGQLRLDVLLGDLCADQYPPTHVLLTLPLASQAVYENPLVVVKETKPVMESLFPFKRLVRDLSLFVMRSSNRGGVSESYALSESIAEEMMRERGYYFIEGQSHYPGHALPEDFGLESDQIDVIKSRNIDLWKLSLSKLKPLSEKYDLKFILVPLYYRENEVAPVSAINGPIAELFKDEPRFDVLGPDYYVLPLHAFSDPVHLNTNGAKLYTQKITILLEDGGVIPHRKN